MEATMQDILDALARMDARLTDALVGRCGEQYARKHTSPFDGSAPPSSIVNTQYRDEAILPPLVHDDAAKVASLDSGNDFGLQQTAMVLAFLGSDEMPSSTTLLAGSVFDRFIPPLYDDDRYTTPQSSVGTIANPDDDLLQELDGLDEDAASANAADDDSGAVHVHAPLNPDVTLDSNVDTSGSPRYPCLPEGATLFRQNPDEKIHDGLIGGISQHIWSIADEVEHTTSGLVQTLIAVDRHFDFIIKARIKHLDPLPPLVPNTDAEEEEVLTTTSTRCSRMGLNHGAYSVPNLLVVCIVGAPKSNEYSTNRVLHRTRLQRRPLQHLTVDPVSAVHGGDDYELSHSEAGSVPATAALPNPREKICCQLVNRTRLARDVRLIFSLTSSNQVLSLHMSTHDFDCASVDRKSCLRAYTPTSMEDEVGHFGLDATEYILDEHSKFLNGELMNQLLDPLPLDPYIEAALSPVSSILQLVVSAEEEVITNSPNRCLMICFNLLQRCFSWDAAPHRQPWPPPHIHVEFWCGSAALRPIPWPPPTSLDSLYTKEFYCRVQFPGFGRTFVFNAEILKRVGRTSEAKDSSRMALKSSWGTLGCSHEEADELASLVDGYQLMRAASASDRVSSLKNYHHTLGLCDHWAEKRFNGHKCVQFHAMEEVCEFLCMEGSPEQKPDSNDQLIWTLYCTAWSGAHAAATFCLRDSIQQQIQQQDVLVLGDQASFVKEITAIICRAGSGIGMAVGLVSSSLGAVTSGQGNFKVLVWDPGGYAYHSLETSCISSGGECQHLRQEQ